MRFILALAGGFAVAGLAGPVSAQTVSQAANAAEFTEQFCGADHSGQHIFVVPISVFSDQKSVTCDNGESMLRTAEPADDPGHIVLNIDPPAGAATGFDCDGKADEGMTTVAINCLPADEESMAHPKSE